MPLESILLKRDIARGDVLLCTAIIRQLKKNNPESRIFFQTKYPEIFAGNPMVERAVLPGHKFDTGFSKTYDLNIAIYEKFKGWHIIDCFGSCCGLKQNQFPKTIDMFTSTAQKMKAMESLGSLTDYIVIAAGPGQWEGRNWPSARWKWLIDQLLEAGEKIVLVGSELDYNLPFTLDLRGKTSEFGHLAAVIQTAKCFIGIDSGPIHVAGALKVPRVGLFGVTFPELILCDSPRTMAVRSDPNHQLSGVRHSVNFMRQVALKHPKDNPMLTIAQEDVLKAYRALFPQ